MQSALETCNGQIASNAEARLWRKLEGHVKEWAEMDKIRAEETAQWETNSAEMEKGLTGVL